MTIFNRREEAFEAKFAHDEEHKFKAHTHAIHMLGLWAAEMSGLSGGAAADYATALVGADVGANANLVLERVVSDLKGRGIDTRQVYGKWEELLALARRSEDNGSLASKD